MSLFEPDRDKVQDSIDLLRMMEPPEGYHLAFSGGKDSIVIYDLAKKSGVKFDPCYYITTVDPPELVWFIKREYPEVKRLRPELSMWQLIRKNKILPTRGARYCCRILKERNGVGGSIVTGVRMAESARRKKRRETEDCMGKKDTYYVHPILRWTDEDVWAYIRSNNLPYPSLYDEGKKRIGCVMCPFGNPKQDMERWPKIAQAYYRALIRAWELRGEDSHFRTVDEHWQWWLSGGNLKESYAYKRTIMDELFV